jgi:hypothetical protein
MKRWIIFVLFSIFLSYPTLSGAATDFFDRGQSTFFNYPLVNIPIESIPESKGETETKGEGEAKKDVEQEKKIMDKKVDDAIK